MKLRETGVRTSVHSHAPQWFGMPWEKLKHAEIDGESILLSSKQVSTPLSVRYGWSDNPCNILYNKEYPAASFCISVEDV